MDGMISADIDPYCPFDFELRSCLVSIQCKVSMTNKMQTAKAMAFWGA
jgi:hypothetical protein